MTGGPRIVSTMWVALVGLGILGIILSLVGSPYFGSVCFLAALSSLLMRALMRANFALSWAPRLLVGPAAFGMVFGLLALQYGPWAGRVEPVALIASSAQLLLFALGPLSLRGRRPAGLVFVTTLGHVGMASGTISLLLDGFVTAVAVAYAGSFALLSLYVYWTHRAERGDAPVRSWEGPYLIVVGLGGLILALAPISISGDSFPFILAALKSHLLLSMALLAGPPHLPASLRATPGGALEFMTQAMALGMLSNIVVVFLLLRVPGLSQFVFLIVGFWLFMAVVFEYLGLVFGGRRSADTPMAPTPPVTVVIAAMNEATTIYQTIVSALELPNVQRLVVVVAARSDDGTSQIVQSLVDAHAGRVVRLPGGASKAADLNAAWKFVETDIGLVLDADEVVDAATLQYGLGLLEDPAVGIVQGRKVAPVHGLLGRFIAIERRFSTLFDHSMQDRLFRAGHFGGSGAMIRKSVPSDAGWWSPVTLTEDIEFTIRVNRDTQWHVRYEPRFVIHEQAPSTFGALLRQRGRWARGWSQVARLHLPAARHSRMERRQKVGFGWQLLTSISAPWTFVFPTLLALWIWGEPVPFPFWLGLFLAIVILPSRMITFVVPYFRDSGLSPKPWPHEIILVILGAYAWIIVGWMLQLQALYLEMSSAPKIWRATRQDEHLKPVEA